ncbi:hypothetical protein HOLleu_00827 [Holothuria leucospilota]|uniref:CCHC-type domain-containing protein n=1 Tax=Holothuria leucospilota TaxID=206669 RepID=A0A9Q1CPH7_HOLLE|nr:hypothetical protein HOLleu_00827 [Holothuria leucospilota]
MESTLPQQPDSNWRAKHHQPGGQLPGRSGMFEPRVQKAGGDGKEYQEVPHRRPQKSVRPAIYDGTTPWDNYSTQFELIAELNGWDNYTKAMYLAANLRGEAQGILVDIGAESRRDYYALVTALRARFSPTNQHEVFRIQLKNRQRQKGETLPELGQIIKRLTRQAYPTASFDVLTALATDHFMDALDDPNLRLGVYQARPTNLDEAIRAALEIEAFHMAERQRSTLGRKMARVVQGNLTDQTTKPEVVEEKTLREMILSLIQQMKDLQSKVEKPPTYPRSGKRLRPIDMTTVQCYQCKEYGHYKRNCPQKKETTLDDSGSRKPTQIPNEAMSSL